MEKQHNKRGMVGLFLILSLCLMFIDWQRHGYFLIVLPAFYLSYRGTFRYVDTNFFLLLVFGVLYGVIDAFNTGIIGYAGFFQPIINFPLLYLAGKEIGMKNDDEYIPNILLLMAISLGFLVISSVMLDVGINGFAVMYRSVQIIGDDNYKASATNAASKLIPLIIFLSLVMIKEKNKRFWMLCLLMAIVAMICDIRIQSRSSIIIAVIAICVAAFGHSYSKRDFLLKMVPIVLFVFFVSYLGSLYSEEIHLIDRFEDTEDLATGNERTELSSGMILRIMSHPLGGLKELKYAHNLWIDMARVSGWLPLLVFLVITIRWIKYAIAIYKDKTRIPVFRVLAIAMNVCLFVYFNVEPILEGAAMLFSYFCVFWGIIVTRVTKSSCVNINSSLA